MTGIQTVAASVLTGVHSLHLDGATLGTIWAVPFIALLLSIAILPLATPQLWHRRYGLITAAWSLVFLIPFAAIYGSQLATREFLHVMLLDYLSFIILIFATYVISGGIYLEGELRGTPAHAPIALIAGLWETWKDPDGCSSSGAIARDSQTDSVHVASLHRGRSSMTYDVDAHAREIYAAHQSRADNNRGKSDTAIRKMIEAADIFVCGWQESLNSVHARFVKGHDTARMRREGPLPPLKRGELRPRFNVDAITCLTASEAERICSLGPQ